MKVICRIVYWALAMACALQTGAAWGHVASSALGRLDFNGDRAEYRLTLVPSEIGEAAALFVRGASGDAEAARQALSRLQQGLALSVDGSACRPARARLQAAGDAVNVLLEWHCAAAPGLLQWRDTTADMLGEHHRTITSIQAASGEQAPTRHEYVFDRSRTEIRIEFGKAAPSGLGGFLQLGFLHILEGADHLLFLAALVLGRRDLRGLLVTVTTFTVAHSVSLAAATLGLVHAPAQWVEPAVAGSVVWAALANIRQRPIPFGREVITFIFGLVHGLAFSEGLLQLGRTGWPLASALLGFNLGVEAAQALLVLACIPVIGLLARWLARRRVEVGLSWGIAAMGAFWLVQRIPSL